MRRMVVSYLAGAVVLTATCASSSGSRSGPRSADVITAEEIARVDLPTAFEVVERLRPQFLRTRGSSTALVETRLVVYQDNMNLGGVDMLRQIRAAEIHEIRFMNASDATTRYGTGHPGGVILVTIRRR